MHLKIERRKPALDQLQSGNHQGFETWLRQSGFVAPKSHIPEAEDSLGASDGGVGLAAGGVMQIELNTGNHTSFLVTHNSLQ